MGKTCERKYGHGKKCKCKKCVVKYREIKCVKSKTERCKYDINVQCKKNASRCDSDSGVWNAGLVYPSGSAFINSPNNLGNYIVVDGSVHATAAFATDATGRPVKTDFAGALLTLPVPAAPSGNFQGVILHVGAVPDGGKNNIIRSRLEMKESTLARIKPNASLLATNEDIAPTVRMCYQVWIKVTYDADPCQCW